MEANTKLTYDTKGLRENLTDLISMISPEETPVMSLAGRTSADAVLHEWQVDALAAADDNNAQLEGDDAAYVAPTSTTRHGNYTQIVRKTAIVSGTLEAVRKAGRRSEMAREMSKKSVELKRDIEAIITSNRAANAGAEGTARRSAGLGAWLKTNTDFEGTGSDPVYTDVPTDPRNDGAQRAFTETIVKSVLQQTFTSGGRPKYIVVGAFNKQAASAFDGVATKTFNRDAEKPTAIIAAADVYVSDFGNLSIIPDLFSRPRDAWFLDPEMISLAWLRPIRSKKLSETGDSAKKMLIGEFTLKVHNEAAHGGAFDLNTA